MIETGTETTGMRVARHSRRKTKTTSTTSAMEMKSVASTFLTDARIVAVWSSAIVRSMPGFMAACSWGSAALIPSTVEMMLAPGWRKMMIRAAGLPFARPRERTVWTESVTLAMSDSRTAAPLW